jgi:hypothetical protein
MHAANSSLIQSRMLDKRVIELFSVVVVVLAAAAAPATVF